MSGSPDAVARALVAGLRALIAEGSVPELDPVELAQDGKPGWTTERLIEALEALTSEGALTRAEKRFCPVPTCRRPISEEDAAALRCPHCTTDFRTLDDPEPVVRAVYRHAGPSSRDLEWAVVIHGMNTYGPWQEEFSWRLALKLRYSAPVLIYKYGKFRIGVLFRPAHRAAVRHLGDRIAASIALAQASNRHRPPDVILHSFATLLFAKLLDEPSFRHLRFGRVILAGSIVRPDYGWRRHIDAERVEAILNHCGSRDATVALAAFAIPDTGPSGHVGAADPGVLNVRAEGYDHSTFFEDRGLDESLAPGGLWDRFLRIPLGTLETMRMDSAPARVWRPLPQPLRRIALPAMFLLAGFSAGLAGWGLLLLACHIFGC